MEKKLKRSKKDHWIGGVCGGIGEYFDIDPTIVRAIWLLLTFGAGFGFGLYLLLWLIMPGDEGEEEWKR